MEKKIMEGNANFPKKWKITITHENGLKAQCIFLNKTKKATGWRFYNGYVYGYNGREYLADPVKCATFAELTSDQIDFLFAKVNVSKEQTT